MQQQFDPCSVDLEMKFCFQLFVEDCYIFHRLLYQDGYIKSSLYVSRKEFTYNPDRSGEGYCKLLSIVYCLFSLT